jgi:hypothetical protein
MYGAWKYSSSPSQLLQWIETRDQLHYLAALTPGKQLVWMFWEKKSTATFSAMMKMTVSVSSFSCVHQISIHYRVRVTRLWILHTHSIFPQHAPAALYGQHQVVLQTHKKEVYFRKRRYVTQSNSCGRRQYSAQTLYLVQYRVTKTGSQYAATRLKNSVFSQWPQREAETASDKLYAKYFDKFNKMTKLHITRIRNNSLSNK